MTEEKYNGWTNYDTWLLNLNLTNEQGLYDSVIEWLKENPKSKYEYNVLRIDAFKDWLYDSFWNDEFYVYKISDSWTERDFQNINFNEILGEFEEINEPITQITTKKIRDFFIETEKDYKFITLKDLVNMLNSNEKEITELIKPLLEEGFIFERKPNIFEML